MSVCKPTEARSSISLAGSWTALEGLADCAGRQIVPGRPERRGGREGNFELPKPTHSPDSPSKSWEEKPRTCKQGGGRQDVPLVVPILQLGAIRPLKEKRSFLSCYFASLQCSKNAES